ncbi:hypothetical protein ACFFF5_07240 [Lederbergia wuyishanensis]|uniref:Ycf1 n=1 Tax=Lederbergia wuyishanensis TaxID=1347903 RepID=A0ABU0D2C3_9BACI|nr:hypothetical protein [Lederbergia wuyishanensis]MCJ8007284.1 hypothetical protein [Lederbergia wuyishanensis]MDQ0342561.1 hypothetical protein [Lederbergia wuyishanensis]
MGEEISFKNHSVKTKIKTHVCDFGPIKQQITLTKITLSDLIERNSKYHLIIKKRNKRQRLIIGISISKQIIQDKKDTKDDICSIYFEDDTFSIKINRLYAVKKIVRQSDNSYLIHYSSGNSKKLHFEVKNWLEKDYYTDELLPLISNAKNQRKKYWIKKKEINAKIKTTKIKAWSRKLTPEEYRRKDFYNSDLYSSHYSPNSDGNRTMREVLGGSGSNMYRKRGKR